MVNPDVISRQPPTINPYRVAWSMFKDRLRWERNPASRRSRKKVRHWLDRHAGEKAVILCNGPSLLKSDLSLLEGTFTFGLNKINLLYDKHEFRPSCVVAVNRLVLEQNAEYYNETETPLFLDSAALKLGIKENPNTHLLHNTNHRRFARDCSISIYQGYTVTYVALQLAFHMGFTEVALIGADHYFSTPGQPNQTVTSESKDPNHFDPNYFANGAQWQLPDLAESELSYIMARDVFHAFGRRVVNAGEGGHLEIFERQPLVDFLKTGMASG
ncbi:MAG: 6-hydroxymethylpterin diphosphokinase MptE-like protein [Gammaproteobacteria bacterium]